MAILFSTPNSCLPTPNLPFHGVKLILTACLIAANMGSRPSLSQDEFLSSLSFWKKDLEGCKLIYSEGGRRSTYQLALDKPLPLGSVTKTFTAILTLKLIEEGKLSVQTPLSKFGFKISGDGSITVQDLLDHTSGLADYFYNVDPASPASASQILKMIRLANSHPLTKGEFHYSNTNYWLLGEICEKIAGVPFSALVERMIGKPLGIEVRAERLPTFDLNWYGGAGSLASSLHDFSVFADALSARSPKLLSKTSWSQLSTARVPMSKAAGDSYGDGVIVTQFSCYPSLTHGGTIPANKTEAYSAIYLARVGSENPMSLVAFCRGEWSAQTLNSLYGLYACENAGADLKGWLTRLCTPGIAAKIPNFVRLGKLNSKLGALLMEPGALRGLQDRVGTFGSFVVRGEVANGTGVDLEGAATGSRGSINVTARFGAKGILDGLRIH